METSSGDAIVVPDSPSDSSISLDKKRKKLVLHHHSRLLKDNTTSSHKNYSKGSGRVTQTSNRCSDVILIDDAPGSVLIASNNTAGVEKHERKSKALSLTTRTTLASFYDSLKKLNPTQKTEVRDTGFGNILELKVKELPGRMAYWALNGNVLFMFKDLELCRFDLVSLRIGSVVQPSVLNAWSIILNHVSIRASSNKPVRFFASTDIYINCISQPGMSYVSRQRAFFGALDRELQLYQTNDLIYIDMRSLLLEFLNNNREDPSSASVAKSTIEVVDLKWADSMNTIDDVLYVMRHMETFDGDTSVNWNIGLLNATHHHLGILRMRYCTTIVSWEHNKYKDDVLRDSAATYGAVIAVNSTRFDRVLAG